MSKKTNPSSKMQGVRKGVQKEHVKKIAYEHMAHAIALARAFAIGKMIGRINSLPARHTA